MTVPAACRSAIAVLSIAVLTAACDVRVRHDDAGDGHGDLDMRTPLGDLSVRRDAGAGRVGLPVYAGARPLRDEGHANADVQIDTPLFALDVAAAKFETGESPETILAFYRTELARYGRVTECHGDVDFVGRRNDRIRCRERWGGSERQLVTGSANDHRMVTVKPRGNGAEFALIHVDTRGHDF